MRRIFNLASLAILALGTIGLSGCVLHHDDDVDPVAHSSHSERSTERTVIDPAGAGGVSRSSQSSVKEESVTIEKSR